MAIASGGTELAADDAEWLRECMRRRERWALHKALLLVGLALFGTLVDVLIVAGIALLFGAGRYIPWIWVFFFSISPAFLLFWWFDQRAIRSGPQDGPIYEDMIGVSEPGFTDGVLYDRRFGNGWEGPLLPGGGKLLLLGPRGLRMACNQLQIITEFQGAHRRRAEQILRTMLALEQGPTVDSLRGSSEPWDELFQALAYLQFHGWIDASHDTQYIWLRGDARAVLERNRAE